MKNKIIVLFFAFMFFGSTACAATFSGKVIDADTKQPIEGAVVVASWHEMLLTAPQSITRFKDVKETLTDKDGEWKIEGPKGTEPGFITGTILLILGLFADKYFTQPPEFIVFKPEYCSWPKGLEIEVCKMKPSVIGDGETIEIRKLTNREDRIKAQRISPSLMDGDREMLKKIKEFIRLKNKERKYLGLEEVDF